MFNKFGQRDGNDRSVNPASQDPYGDPADNERGNVRPASEDPLGDPAFGGRKVRPASEDPLGDPG
ncbi:MAG: translation initiation factor [Leptolyngbya sp.]|nr:translation initiation factor [Candidatus Melainabacteria bacterium]